MPSQAILFDAYGTLFDVHSVIAGSTAALSCDTQALSQLWRRTQVELTWRYALMERYEDFYVITDHALRQSFRELAIPASETQIEQLMRSYLAPAVFPDARVALDQLRHLPLGI